MKSISSFLSLFSFIFFIFLTYFSFILCSNKNIINNISDLKENLKENLNNKLNSNIILFEEKKCYYERNEYKKLNLNYFNHRIIFNMSKNFTKEYFNFNLNEKVREVREGREGRKEFQGKGMEEKGTKGLNENVGDEEENERSSDCIAVCISIGTSYDYITNILPVYIYKNNDNFLNFYNLCQIVEVGILSQYNSDVIVYTLDDISRKCLT